MAVNFIYTDDLNAATSALYAPPNKSMREYLNNSVNNYVSNIKSYAPNLANNVIEKYNAITNSSAVQYLSNLKNRIQSTWQTDTIRYLPDINAIQQAPEAI